jgi:hypothetical protein
VHTGEGFVPPSDQQLLDQARRILMTTPRKLHAAQLIAMIVARYRAPMGGHDPYCRKHRKHKALQLGK